MPWTFESTRLVINVPIYCQPTTKLMHECPRALLQEAFMICPSLMTLRYFCLFLMPCGKVCDDMNIINFFLKCSNHP